MKKKEKPFFIKVTSKRKGKCPIAVRFGNNLKVILLEKKMKPRHLALQSGISPPVISTTLTGYSSLRLSSIVAIRKALDVPLERLMEGCL